MADPVGDIIGDYAAFAATQLARLAARGIDIAPQALSHQDGLHDKLVLIDQSQIRRASGSFMPPANGPCQAPA